MKLTERQRAELYQATAAAYNHYGRRRPFRVMREARRTLRVKFGWQEIFVTLIVQVIVKLIEKWIEGDLPFVDPNSLPADFCLGDVAEEWEE